VSSVLVRDIAEVRGGGTPRKSVPKYFGGGIPWVTPKDMKRWLIGESEVTLTLEGVENSPAKIVPPGSVLLVVRSGVLKHTLPVALTTTPVTLNQDMKALIPSRAVDGGYLARLVKARQKEVLGWVRATTADNFPIEKLLDLQIELPRVDQQRRIAAILDQADALRAKRRQVLAHLDALNQSIFQDIFDGRQTKAALLGDVAEVVSGITKGRRTTEPTQPFPYLAVANVQAGHLKLDTVKTIDATDSEVSRFALRTGDLVLTEGGDPDKLGRGTVWRGEIATCLHQNHVFRVRLSQDSQVLPDYLSAFLAGREAKSYFLRSAKQTTGIASINMTQLKGLSIVVPPLMDQSRYVERIANINSCVDRAKESLTMHDRLFSALQSRAFRGEL